MGKIIQGNFKHDTSEKNVAIIAAGGKGTRMGLDFNKIFLSVEDKPILAYTIEVFEKSDIIDEIILVCSKDDFPLCKDIVEDFEFKKVSKLVLGGSTRQESVRNGLDAISSSCKIVLVHDAARPLVTEKMIEDTVKSAEKDGAASVGISPVDTVKIVENQMIMGTVDRNTLVLIQTPQAFQFNILKDAHENAKRNHQLVTDDCALCELIGQPITVVPGSKENIKLTTPEDYAMISAFLTCYRIEDDDND